MSDNTFSLVKYSVKCKPGEIYRLIPFGDVHYDSPLAARDRFREFCQESKNMKNTIFLGMGDFLDLASYTERNIFQNSQLHESTRQTLDDLYDRHVNELYKEISFMKGRVIGLLEGNHHGLYINGTTTTQKLCEKLGCRYLGIAAFVRITFKYQTKTASVDVFAHHGKGGSGRMVGSDLNHIQAMSEISDAQINLQGHTHKKSIAMKTRLSLTDKGHRGLNVAHKKIIFARTGSFLKGWEPGAPSYVVKACMSPTDLGVVRIDLNVKRQTETVCNKKVHDYFFIDIHGSI